MAPGRGRDNRQRPDRNTQLLKGVLDMCLLAVIAEEPSYGYEMVRKLTERGLTLVSEGAIYPVLSRLQRNGLVEGYLVASPEGPARKYYRIEEKGTAALEEWSNAWRDLSKGVENVLGGDTDE
jgi:PadR family transcriptional regulator, regulatory protein PadR